MGIDDLIVADADEYVAVATRVVADADWRRSLSDRIVGAWPTIFERQATVDELQLFLLAASEAARGGRRLGRWAPGSVC
jgi:hypothetical protein